MNSLPFWFRNILVSLLIIGPFIPVLSSKISFLSSPLSLFISGYKEIVQVFLMFFVLFLFFKYKLFRLITRPSLVLLVIPFYFFFHFIGYMPIDLIFDGYRYQIGYILIFCLLTLLPLNHKSYGIDPNLCAKIIVVQFFIVATIGILEFFYPEIIFTIYGINKTDMAHVTLGGEFRLISIFLNPINFGAFLCVSFCSISYFALLKNSTFYWLLFWLLWSVCLFLIFFTLSRLALITFFIQTLIVLFYNLKRIELVSTLFIVGFSFFIVPSLLIYLNNFESLYLRFDNLFNTDTYTGNSRIENWLYAFKFLDNIYYFLWGLGAGASNPTLGSGGLMIENSFVSILIDFGFIGFSLYILLCIIVLKRLFSCLYFPPHTRYFLILFFISFFLMSLGNDLNRNFPFNFYFWYFVSCALCRNKIKSI